MTITLKILYLCEYCGDVVDEADTPSRPGGLTAGAAVGIMDMKSGGGKIVIEVVCTDCWETIYGGHDNGLGIYIRPYLH